MFVIAADKPTLTDLGAYYIGRSAHAPIRHWSDGSTHLGCCEAYETRELADADFDQCFGGVRKHMAVRPMTAREWAYRRLGMAFDHFMRAAEWTSEGQLRFERRKARIAGRVA